MLFARKYYSMINNKKNHRAIIIIIFILIQLYVVGLTLFSSSSTVSLECTSSFIRNFDDQPNIIYTGEMTLTLSQNGEGNFTIHGDTNENVPRKFHWAYFFNYFIDGNGVFKAEIITRKSGLSNELDEALFRKQFFGLGFQLRGGLHIHKFRNVYILNIPGFIVNTCAPVQSTR